MKTAIDDAPYVVQYHTYDPRLPDVFEKIRRLVQASAEPVSVEHVGSSSIPGLGVRNALDIAIAAPEAQQPQIRHPEDARAYDAVKQEAIANGKTEGNDYQEAKNPFLAGISAKLKLRRQS